MRRILIVLAALALVLSVEAGAAAGTTPTGLGDSTGSVPGPRGATLPLQRRRPVVRRDRRGDRL